MVLGLPGYNLKVMPTSIALLRSVNVLGKNMIKMPELARAFEVTYEYVAKE